MLSGTTSTCAGINGPLAGGGLHRRDLHGRARAAGAPARAPSIRRAAIGWMTAGPANERQLHDARATRSPLDAHGELRVLRLGKQADLDARSPPSLDVDGHDRASEERHERHRRHERQRRHERHRRARAAPPARRRGRQRRGRDRHRRARRHDRARRERRHRRTRGHDGNSRHDRHGRTRRHHAAALEAPAAPERPAPAAPAASTDPATSTRPPARRAGRRTARFARSRKTYTGPLYQVRNGSSAMNTGSGGMTEGHRHDGGWLRRHGHPGHLLQRHRLHGLDPL